MSGVTTADAGPPPVGARRAFGLSVWFGLVTGIGSAALIGVQKFVLDRVTLSSPQMVWTAPLLLIVIFVPIGMTLWLPIRFVTPRLRTRAFVFLLSLVSCFVGLMIWGKQLQDAAALILSLGIAVQLSHIAAHRPRLFARFVRYTGIAAVAIAVLGAAIADIGGPLRERYRTARLPEAAAGAPNVLLIILDTVRSLDLSLYGYERPTSPSLARFARDATVFDDAIAPAPWTLPSHASIFTGRPAHELSADWEEPLDEGTPTLAEHFHDLGYRTGGFAGNWFYANSEWGIDRGFLHYSDFSTSLGHALASTSVTNKLLKWMEQRWQSHFWFHRLGGRRIAPDISDELVHWLERDRNRPFFAFANYYDAHDPYTAPDSFIARFVATPRPTEPPVRTIEDGVARSATPRQRTGTLREIDRYDAAIAYLDSEIGKLLHQLRERGLLDNTLVVITADHGEEFGENGRYWHGQSMHAPALHVPLVIRFPGAVPAGRRIDAVVSLTDLAETIVRLADPSSPRAFPGESLARFWLAGPAVDAGPVTASLRLRTPRPRNHEKELRSVFNDSMHYTLSDIGLESLYRYRKDPLEQRDLMSDTATAGIAASLRALLEAGEPWVKRSGSQ